MITLTMVIKTKEDIIAFGVRDLGPAFINIGLPMLLRKHVASCTQVFLDGFVKPNPMKAVPRHRTPKRKGFYVSDESNKTKVASNKKPF